MTIEQEAEELAQACDALTNCLMLVPGLDTVNCARVLRSMAAEIASLHDDMNWIERCANHHGQKADVTAAKALSFIQHYPPIRAITKSYADGVVPDTPNPYAEIEQLKEELEEWRFTNKIDEMYRSLERKDAFLRDAYSAIDFLLTASAPMTSQQQQCWPSLERSRAAINTERGEQT